MGGDDLVRRVGRPLLFIAAFVLAHRVTEGITLESGFAPWFPPAGMVLAYLLAVGPKAAGTVLVARLVSIAVVFPDAYRDEADGVIVRAVAITACYTAAAYALRRIGLHHARLRELGWFATIGVVGAPLGAALSVAAVSVALLGDDASSAFDAAWTFWIGDAVAVATVVPAALLLLAASRGLITPPRLPSTRRDRVEVLLQSLALIVVPVVALSVADRGSGTGFLVLAVMPVVWVAVRGDLLFAAIGLLVLNVSLSVVAGVSLGATAELSELQAVMLAAALASLYVAAVTHTHDMAQADLLDSEERYRSLLAAAPDLVARFDSTGDCIATSEPPWLGSEGARPVLDSLRWAWGGAGQAVLADGKMRTIELTVRSADGDQHLLARLVAERRADGSIAGLIAVVSDLTAQRQALALLDHERRHDALTGVANRARFLAELSELARSGASVGLAVLDVDGFVTVNEVFGPERGDSVLREIADRLRRVAGPGASVGRLGADQFAVALAADEQSGSALGAELVRTLRLRVADGDRSLFLTGSVGMVIGAGSDPRVLLRDADTAMHAAKEAGRDRFVLLDEARRAATLDRRGNLSHLRGCLARTDIVVHYQPIVDLETLEVQGLEALVRLPAPEGEGLLFPASFLTLAEEAGLDVELGSLVLDAALAQLAELNAGGAGGALMMSVNVTARQLAQADFVDRVLAGCIRHGVSPRCIRLELTETLVLADPDAAVAALHALREMGISAALDDFGVGYSSMVYLQRLPVDVLKIDRAFVTGLPDDGDDQAIVSLVVGLADSLGLSATAEGIETEGQRAALLALGCRTGQGYLFGRPDTVDQLGLLPRAAPSGDGQPRR